MGATQNQGGFDLNLGAAPGGASQAGQGWDLGLPPPPPKESSFHASEYVPAGQPPQGAFAGQGNHGHQSGSSPLSDMAGQTAHLGKRIAGIVLGMMFMLVGGGAFLQYAEIVNVLELLGLSEEMSTPIAQDMLPTQLEIPGGTKARQHPQSQGEPAATPPQQQKEQASMLESAAAATNQGTTESPAESPEGKAEKAPAQQSAASTSTSAETTEHSAVPRILPTTIGDQKLANPYWGLPNEIEDVKPLDRIWSAQEEDTWRNSISHQFMWQRHKTVLDIRKMRLTGSSVILWDALSDKSFWTRMRAAAGLADLGIPVALDVIEKGLGNTRPSLVRNYFKRFQRRVSPGDLYLLRQVIRIADEPTRLEILKAFHNAKGQSKWLYLTAALYDQAPSIHLWARRQGLLVGIPQTRVDELRRDVEKFADSANFESPDTSTPQQAVEAAEKSPMILLENKPKETLNVESIQTFEVPTEKIQAPDIKDVEFDEAF